MKLKIFALLLCLVTLLSACQKAPAASTGSTAGGAAGSSAASTAPTAPPTSRPTLSPEYSTAPEVSDNCGHQDANTDYLCDLCQGKLLVELDIFTVNDLHGKFLDSTSQPGVDELTSYLLSQTGNTLFLSAGDMWQGSSESNLTGGLLLTQWMNELGFAAMTLGNHEFDWGEVFIRNNAEIADFPFLAINIFDRSTDQPVSYCQPSVVVERGGLQIGIIGAIGDCYSSISSDKVENIYFKTGQQLTALVKDEATRLRSEGADVIVYVLHDGHGQSMDSPGTLSSGPLSGYYDDSLSNGYVDIVFEGHTHKHYVFADRYGVYHLQGGGENAGISQATLVYNILTEDVVYVNARFVSSNVYDDHAPHPGIQDLLDQFQTQLEPGNRVVGYSGKYWRGDDLRQLIAQLYYEAGMECWGDSYDIALGGGFISIRNPWNLEPGEVKYSLLQALFPFDNQIVLCSIKGSDLLRNFVGTSRENYFIHLGELPAKVDPNGTYYIVTDTYCSSYAPNNLTLVAEYEPGIYARDLLADYIAQGNLESDPAPEEYELTDIPTLLRICDSLAPGAISQETYFVKGKIVSVASTKYGNMTIEDENGNRLYIYGTYDETGMVRYDGMENPPQVGDTVILMGCLQNYVPPAGKPVYEMVEARILEQA